MSEEEIDEIRETLILLAAGAIAVTAVSVLIYALYKLITASGKRVEDLGNAEIEKLITQFEGREESSSSDYQPVSYQPSSISNDCPIHPSSRRCQSTYDCDKCLGCAGIGDEEKFWCTECEDYYQEELDDWWYGD